MQYMYIYMASCKIPLNFIWISASSQSEGVSTETKYKITTYIKVYREKINIVCLVQSTWLYFFKVRRGARKNRGYNKGYDKAKK